MPKCKSCYHFHMCDLQYRIEEDQECKHFKDDSLIVELPCKVGTVAYIIINESEKFGGSYIKEEKIVEVSTAGRIWTDSCYYDDDDIGKTVFLSHEEAEKKLKECENETKT